MSEAATAVDYDRWLRGRSLSAQGYALLASVPGQMAIKTPVFRLEQELELNPGQRVLDIGCGRASVLQVLASRVRFEHPPAGVDLSAEMLRRARADIAREGRLKIHLVRGSGTGLPFADASFDVALSTYVLKHLDDRELVRFLQEMRRVLRPGGIALVWEFSPTRSEALNRWHRWVLTRGVGTCNLRSFADLAAAATSAGFEWVRNAHLRPFLFPPIPRASAILGKAPEGWGESPATEEPDLTRAFAR